MLEWEVFQNYPHKSIGMIPFKKKKKKKKATWNQGYRNGSEVKSTDCSSRDPEFKSQQPHGSSQPSVIRSDALS
jgi:hypothetical protein